MRFFSCAFWLVLGACFWKASLSLADFRSVAVIDRFDESEVPSSAAFGIWNANTVFSLVDLLAITCQSTGTENCTRSTIVKSIRSVGCASAVANKHVAKTGTTNGICDFIARIVGERHCKT